ncbi:FAD-dependent oxidoreductase [Candidatus Woesearchaeota archaeon]|nr:FAD-dependent oxidoreductase [Candidatus Woesearchaeota archaeon]
MKNPSDTVKKSKKRAVIIGGGFAGSKIAKELQNRFETTLIDSKDHFEFTPSILRVIAEPEYLKKIQVKHSGYLGKTRIIIGDVEEVTAKEIRVNIDGKEEKVKFDYLIIASGSTYRIPIKHNNTIVAYNGSVLEKHSSDVKNKDVLIVGGGLVGVELAAEMADISKVTLIEGADEILGRNNKKTREYAKKWLHKKGVKIITNELVVESDGKHLITNNKTKINPEFVFLCTGISPNSGFMHKNFGKHLGKRGHIIVNKHLQMEEYPNIFAAGDITDILEEKTAQSAEKQADVVIENIKRIEKGNSNLELYKSKSRPMVISLGKYNGILCYKEFTITGMISAILKKYIEWKSMIKVK